MEGENKKKPENGEQKLKMKIETKTRKQRGINFNEIEK